MYILSFSCCCAYILLLLLSPLVLEVNGGILDIIRKWDFILTTLQYCGRYSHKPKHDFKSNQNYSRCRCYRPQEPTASVTTSGIWPARPPCCSSSCAGNTWPQLCALWVTPPWLSRGHTCLLSAFCGIILAPKHVWDIKWIPPWAAHSGCLLSHVWPFYEVKTPERFKTLLIQQKSLNIFFVYYQVRHERYNIYCTLANM